VIVAVVLLAALVGLLGGLVLALLEERRARIALLFERTAERDAARALLQPGRVAARFPGRWR
jgi:hypothetical protein